MPQINYLAVLAAALSVFAVGGLWYSPLLFLNPWLKDFGLKPQKMGHGPWPFVYSFIFALIGALAFALVSAHHPDAATTVKFGVIVGAGWVATSFGINYKFAARSNRLLLIDGGYHIVQFLLYGLIIGYWR